MFCANILELSAGLKTYPFVDYILKKTTTNIYNINNNIIIELDIIPQDKVKAI
jgi:hypothetical protein